MEQPLPPARRTEGEDQAMSTSENDAAEQMPPSAPGAARDLETASPAGAASELDAQPVPVPDDQPVATSGEAGDTVEPLAQKADVKGQVAERKETLHATQQQAQAKVEEIGTQVKQRPQPFVIGAIIAALA